MFGAGAALSGRVAFGDGGFKRCRYISQSFVVACTPPLDLRSDRRCIGDCRTRAGISGLYE